MKKLLVFLFAFFAIGSFAYAAEDVGVMDLSFCNGLNHYVVTLNTGEDTHAICMHIKNKGFTTSSINLALVDGEFSHGDRPVQACKTNANGFFGRSTVISGENTVTLASSEEVDKYITFTRMTGFVGVLHGCITYSVVDTETADTNAPMSVLTRKANLIDITVPGEVASNFYLIPLTGVAGSATKLYSNYGNEIAGSEVMKLLYKPREGIMTTFIGIENSGFVDEDWKTVFSFSSFFGLFSWHDESNVAQLYAQTNTMGDQIDYLPRYNLFVKVHVSVQHRPVAMSPGMQPGQWQSIDYSYQFFLIPWYEILIGFIVLLLLIGLIIRLIKYIRRKIKQTHAAREQLLKDIAELHAAKEKETHREEQKEKPAAKKKVASAKPAAKAPAKKPAAPRKAPAKKKAAK